MIYLKLFFEFFKTGLFSIGGGLATLPFLYKMGEKTGWFTSSELANMLAVSESTPGPIGVNMATYVGYNVGGLIGAVLTTFGLILPEIIIIIIIAKILGKFRSNKFVDAAFQGLRPCSVALISASGLLVCKIAFFDSGVIEFKAVILASILIVLTRFVPKVKDFHPVFFIILSAVAGVVLKF